MLQLQAKISTLQDKLSSVNNELDQERIANIRSTTLAETFATLEESAKKDLAHLLSEMRHLKRCAPNSVVRKLRMNESKLLEENKKLKLVVRRLQVNCCVLINVKRQPYNYILENNTQPEKYYPEEQAFVLGRNRQ